MALYSKVYGTSPDSLKASANSKTVKSTRDNGKTANLKEKESRLGLMGASTTEYGWQESPSGKV